MFKVYGKLFLFSKDHNMEENSAQCNNFMMYSQCNNNIMIALHSELDVAFSSLAKIMHMTKIQYNVINLWLIVFTLQEQQHMVPQLFKLDAVAFSNLLVSHREENSAQCINFMAYSFHIARATTYCTPTFLIRCGSFF